MLLYNARANNQGFTLVEALTVVIIVSILSAIAVPSFLAMLNQNKVNDALAQVRGAFQEAQREAIRKSKSCTVKVITDKDKDKDPTTKDPATTVSSNCLATGNRLLPKGINIEYDPATVEDDIDTVTWKVIFDFKGRTNNAKEKETMYLTTIDTSATKKCLVVSQGLGMIRTGKYTENGDKKICETSR